MEKHFLGINDIEFTSLYTNGAGTIESQLQMLGYKKVALHKEIDVSLHISGSQKILLHTVADINTDGENKDKITTYSGPICYHISNDIKKLRYDL